MAAATVFVTLVLAAKHIGLATERLQHNANFQKTFLPRRRVIQDAASLVRCRRAVPWAAQDVAAFSNTDTTRHRGHRVRLFAALEPWETQHIDHADYLVTRLCAALCLVAGEKRGAASGTGARPARETEFRVLVAHADRLVRYMGEHPGLADAALRSLLDVP
ncbi:hypothetical protein J7T55_002088 [Diaporthe amygdali]|uniref:uncharacterized protein n=1 Tax=Phomopsis amygdali TaxID=1214568 RepID=UPI0022FE87C4|nr:uncharacterized protein J7T55_002088 [Diaporthe amygdali]KAJ0108484.1 hypothetical protein J7T55_002088 [Diaporthe amygdali]